MKALKSAGFIPFSLGCLLVLQVSSCENNTVLGGRSKKQKANAAGESGSGGGQNAVSKNSNDIGNSSFPDQSGTSSKVQTSNKSPLKVLTGFLSDLDFEVPYNMEATTAKALSDQINANGAFFPSGWLPKEGQECSELEKDKALDGGVIEVVDGVAVVDFVIDASACNKVYPGGVPLTWKPGKGLLKVACLADLNGFAGKKWGQAKKELTAACDQSGLGSTLFQAAFVGVLDLSSTGSPIPSQELTVTIARMSPENEGCMISRDNTTLTYGPCRNIIQVQREFPGVSTYSEFVFDSLKSVQGKNMFTEGTGYFLVNGWEGKMNFTEAKVDWSAYLYGQKTSGLLQPGY